MTATLHTIDAEPCPENSEIITRLEEAMALAKEGKISSVAITVVNRDGTATFGHSFLPSYSLMIGALERHKFRLMMTAES